jgi:protein-L-isoaspartate(D-aspartate) O-methyltransferase
VRVFIAGGYSGGEQKRWGVAAGATRAAKFKRIRHGAGHMDPAVLRDDMVDSLEHEAKAVVSSERVSVAMREVPREPFLEDGAAYADRSFERLGTRVLSPSAAGRLFEALEVRPDDTVLVVGSGVGYTAAVLAELVGARHTTKAQAVRAARLVADGRVDPVVRRTVGLSEVPAVHEQLRDGETFGMQVVDPQS